MRIMHKTCKYGIVYFEKYAQFENQAMKSKPGNQIKDGFQNTN